MPHRAGKNRGSCAGIGKLCFSAICCKGKRRVVFRAAFGCKKISSNQKDACYSLQETAFAMIGEATERALSFTEKKELLIVGGVSANKRLSEILKKICQRQKCKFFVSPIEYAGDCGSQIAWTGLLEATAKKGAKLDETFVRQSWRLDTVEIDY
ncbi:hypothetical protein QVH35_05250 [Candidatus Nitrosotenuis chungbukensis]|uniref:hypothetical protein n=1 Tax=Candidatus Nitrosotenuis chungbukensis TaxID=1353246 RepID=UPI0026723E70|nr:hypothetical protein [Candidatus Nitrosotenuis chungbukensis]WKT58742.1 hypothetical protein QVH35_05250 [Candidatus Nitrosotenuis chungbukensis]